MLPKRVTQDEARGLAFELLDGAYPGAPGTVDAYISYVEDQAFVKQIPAWPSLWTEEVADQMLGEFEFWCMWSSMMSDDQYTKFVYTWNQ